MALTNKLTAIADAIRGKTGKTEEMTLDQMVTEIAGIQTGGGSGGNANTYSGDLIFDADTTVYDKGVTLNFGLPSRVKYLLMWFDRDEFLAIETPTNNYWYGFIILPMGVDTLPPIRVNNSTSLTIPGDRMYLTFSTISQTASSSGYGINGPAFATSNADKWATACHDDGTVTAYRYNTSASIFMAGTYHWIAVC